jgi:flagellar biosynthesis chaperone FliJ
MASNSISADFLTDLKQNVEVELPIQLKKIYNKIEMIDTKCRNAEDLYKSFTEHLSKPQLPKVHVLHF